MVYSFKNSLYPPFFYLYCGYRLKGADMNENITYIFQGTNYMDLTLYQYGRETCAPLLSCGPAAHNHYLLHYILDGKGLFTIGTDRSYSLHAGQSFIIFYKLIATYSVDNTAPLGVICFDFDARTLPPLPP